MEGLLVLAVLLGLIPAKIAESKGHSFGIWWLYGSLLFIVALPHSMFLTKEAGEVEKEQIASGGLKKCAFCAELIKPEAVLCRFCGREQPKVEFPASAPSYVRKESHSPSEMPIVIGIAVTILLVVLVMVWFAFAHYARTTAGTAVAPAEQFFANVEALRRAATPELPAVNWEGHRKSGGYMGHTGEIPITQGSRARVAEYCISGYVATRAAEATISVISGRTEDLPNAKAKLKSALQAWFANARVNAPPGLYSNISEDGRFEGDADGVSIQYATTACPARMAASRASTGHCTLLEVAMKPVGADWPRDEWSCRYGSRQKFR